MPLKRQFTDKFQALLIGSEGVPKGQVGRANLFGTPAPAPDHVRVVLPGGHRGAKRLQDLSAAAFEAAADEVKRVLHDRGPLAMKPDLSVCRTEPPKRS